MQREKLKLIYGELESLSHMLVEDKEIEIKFDDPRWIGNGSGIVNSSVKFYIDNDNNIVWTGLFEILDISNIAAFEDEIKKRVKEFHDKQEQCTAIIFEESLQ